MKFSPNPAFLYHISEMFLSVLTPFRPFLEKKIGQSEWLFPWFPHPVLVLRLDLFSLSTNLLARVYQTTFSTISQFEIRLNSFSPRHPEVGYILTSCNPQTLFNSLRKLSLQGRDIRVSGTRRFAEKFYISLRDSLG